MKEPSLYLEEREDGQDMEGRRKTEKIVIRERHVGGE